MFIHFKWIRPSLITWQEGAQLMSDGPGWEGQKEGEQSKFCAVLIMVLQLPSEAASPVRHGVLTQWPGALSGAQMQLTDQGGFGSRA